MKNLLLTTTLLLLAGSAIAQLSVRPNGTDPSYIYADNVQIYVQDDIALAKNAGGDFEASIYLRGDSQLFQGGTAAGNSGDGLLSVYQTTNADQYDYNFWSSPVGLNNLATGNSMNGPLRLNVSNDLTSLPTDTGTTTFVGGYNGSSTDNTLNIASYWLYRLPNETMGWQFVGGTDGVQAGYGFSMKGTNDSSGTPGNTTLNDGNIQQYDFRGRPNTGDIDIVLTSDESTLAGNPYPSALDLAIFFNDNPGIQEIQFWDEDRSIPSHLYVDNKGGYGTWVPLDAAGNTAGAGNNFQGMYTAAPFLDYNSAGEPITSPGDPGVENGGDYPRRFSPIGQGFIVKALPGATSATFSNSQRVFVPIGTNSIFRTADQATTNKNSSTSYDAFTADTGVEENANTGLPYMRLNAYFPGSHRREMALAFSNKATKGFDRGYDAHHPMDASSEMAMTLEDGTNLVIQTLAFSPDYKIPLMVKADIPGSVLFSAYEETNLPFNDAYLYDAELSTYQLITDGNVATINMKQAGEITNRYFIVFKSQSETYEDFALETGLKLAQETVDVFQDNRLAVMEVLNPERFDIKQAAVYDMTGKVVHTESNIGQQTRYSFPTASLSDGVYIVMLTTQDNLVLDYKVTIFNKK